MVEKPFIRNVLLLRDLRGFNRFWYRSKWLWSVLMLGLANYLFCAWLYWTKEAKPRMDDYFPYLLYCFTTFHILLFFWLPIQACLSTRKSIVSSNVESCLVTPIPRSDYFWWLWWKNFLPVIFTIFLVYLPLVIAFSWLRRTSMIEDPLGDEYARAYRARFRFRREIGCDFLFVILLCLPWVKSSLIRFGSWFVAFVLLYVVLLSWHYFQSTHVLLENIFGTYSPNGDRLADKIGVYATHAQFHPAVTVLFFLTSAAWGAAAGVWVGLRRRLSQGQALTLVLLLVPGAELMACLLVFFPTTFKTSFFGEWMFLWYLLLLYLTPAGILLMGIKWNLLCYVSRRSIELE